MAERLWEGGECTGRERERDKNECRERESKRERECMSERVGGGGVTQKRHMTDRKLEERQNWGIQREMGFKRRWGGYGWGWGGAGG